MTALDLVSEIEDLGPRPEFRATVFGPVWRTDEDGDFLLPEIEMTFGLQAVAWCADYLRAPDGGPWSFTWEQLRLVLWWFTVKPMNLDHSEDSPWLYRDLVIQKVKGWG